MARKKSMLDVANQFERISSQLNSSKAPFQIRSNRYRRAEAAARLYTGNMSQLTDSRINSDFRHNKAGMKKYSRAYYMQSRDKHLAKLAAKGAVAG